MTVEFSVQYNLKITSVISVIFDFFQVVPLLTLKNVTSVVDVALAFNAKSLFDTCLQFMCQHFNALLQTPFFYDLDDDTLSKLEDAYRYDDKKRNRILVASLDFFKLNKRLDLEIINSYHAGLQLFIYSWAFVF